MLVVEAMPTLSVSSLGISAEKPSLVAVKLARSWAIRAIAPALLTSAPSTQAWVLPSTLLRAILPLARALVSLSAYTLSAPTSRAELATKACTSWSMLLMCKPTRDDITEP